MKTTKPRLPRGMAALLTMVLAIGAAAVLAGRLDAQEANPPPAAASDEPNPANGERATPPPGRVRAARLPAGGGIPPRAPTFPLSRSTPTRAPSDIALARFEAIVFEVQLPENRVAELDLQALEGKAATAQDLGQALQAFGKTRVLHKIDQPVNLYGETITLGSSTPMVTGSRMTDGGTAINSISYQQVGLVINLAASVPPPESSRAGLDVQFTLELSAAAESGVEIAPKVPAVSIRNLQLTHSETIRMGKPQILLNVSAPPAGEKGLPTAYVVRYAFGEIKP